MTSSSSLVVKPPSPEPRTNQFGHMRSIKMDFPRFDGSQALQWLHQAELFFKYYEISYFYLLKIASIHFDAPIIPWFHMLQKSGTIISWHSLAKAIKHTYGP